MSVVSTSEIIVQEAFPRQDSQQQLVDYPSGRLRADSDDISPGRCMSLTVIYFSVFVDMLGFSLIMPSLPELSLKLGANGFMYGVIQLSYSTAQMGSTFFCRILSSYCGRRPLIILCLLGSALSLIAMGYVSSLQQLILVRALDGGMSTTMSIAQGYITDLTKPKERAKFMGIIGLASGVGLILGPSIGGLIRYYFDFKITCFVGASLSLFNFVFAILFLKESKPRQTLIGSVFGSSVMSRRLGTTMENPRRPEYSPLQALWIVYQKNTGIKYVLVAFFLAHVAWTPFQTFFMLYGIYKFGLTPEYLGIIFSGFALVMIVSQMVLTYPVSKCLGWKWATISGSILRTAGLVAVVYMPTVWSFVACAMDIPISGALINPCLSRLILHFTDKYTYGGIVSWNHFMAGIARAIALLACGWLYDINKVWPFQIFGAGAMALTALSLLPLSVSKKNRSSQQMRRA